MRNIHVTNKGIGKGGENEEIRSEVTEKSPSTWPPSSFLQNQSKSGKIQQKIKDWIQTGW